jgi:hypothetical protein
MQANRKVPQADFGIALMAHRCCLTDQRAAPCPRRISATSVCPRRSAHARGVAHSGSSGRFMGAPRASRNATISGMLVRAAYNRTLSTNHPSPKARHIVFLNNKPATLPGWAELSVE